LQQQGDSQGVKIASRENRIVLALVAAAGLISCITIAGWIFDIALLKTFGVSGNPVWPLTALGFLFLSAGFWARVMKHRAVPFLIAVPLFIAVCALVEGAFGISLGTDALLFSRQLDRMAALHPGRPGSNSIAAFGLLGLALLASARRGPAFAELANVLATAALCFGLLSIALLAPLEFTGEIVPLVAARLPSSLATIALASAFLLWRHEAGWMVLLTTSRKGRLPIGLMLRLVIVLPIIPTVIVRWGMPMTADPIRGLDALAVFSNVAIVGFLLWLAVDRLTRQQSSLRQLSFALDSAAIALTRPCGKITHWSRGCEQLYGWTAAEAVGQRKYELLRSRCEQVGAPGLPRQTAATELELVEQCRDGTEISVLERIQLLDRPDLESLVVLKMIDISERVRAEAALRASEARLSAAADAHQIGVSDWDVATGRIEWSPGSEHRLGLPSGGIDSFEQWQALIDPDDVRDVMETITLAAAQRRERVGFKYRFRQPNGLLRTIEGSARCFYDANGDLARVIGANVDITAQIEREAALAAREAQLRSVLDAAPSAMVVVNQQGLVVEFSPSAERLWGYAAVDVIGQPVAMLAAPEEHDRLKVMVARQLPVDERSIAPGGSTAVALDSAGRRLVVEVSVGRAPTQTGILVTMFCHDVSDRLATERRLSELSADLAHISRQSAMSELAADLAHELNQPLSATSNFLAAARMLIERGGDSERVVEMLRMGEEQTLRSGEIIRRLRDFLAKREGEMRGESLKQTVQEAVELVLFGTAQFDIRLTYRLDPAADAVFADRIQVQQVLVNLLRNAVDALRGQSAHTREIVIASRAVDDMTEISVADNGPGLPEAVREQLYSRFATTKSGTAMGIGLSISRRIIEAHGGTLVAENRPEGGAIFRFTLPTLEELEETEE
jgi:two-component system sensor kinase FixL